MKRGRKWKKRKLTPPSEVPKTPSLPEVVDDSTHKKLFLAALGEGASPGDAAKFAMMSRSTAYKWRKEDEEFANNWDEAWDVGTDHMESVVFKRAEDKSDVLALAILRARRPHIWGRTDTSERPNDFDKLLNSTLQEKLQRIERLGLPAPRIESDFEAVVDVADDDTNNP